jgi:hypothetical protein
MEKGMLAAPRWPVPRLRLPLSSIASEQKTSMSAPQTDPSELAEGEPYTRDELQRGFDGLPTRGPVCPKCRVHIPQFRDLVEQDEKRVRKLISDGRPDAAMYELSTFTGCPISWAKIWVLHSGRADAVSITAPCPYCGKPLMTARARQCQHCLMDWHDADNPRKLEKWP